jgi:hypothetical protein
MQADMCGMVQCTAPMLCALYMPLKQATATAAWHVPRSTGDMPVASRLALELAAAGAASSWPVCAAVGQDQRLEDAGARRTLLAFAAVHCDVEQLPDVLEDLQICDRRLLQPGG